MRAKSRRQASWFSSEYSSYGLSDVEVAAIAGLLNERRVAGCEARFRHVWLSLPRTYQKAAFLTTSSRWCYSLRGKIIESEEVAVAAVTALSALCVAAYAPTLNLPLMEDDYPNIAQALKFGSPVAPLAEPHLSTARHQLLGDAGGLSDFPHDAGCISRHEPAAAYREHMADLFRAACLAANARGAIWAAGFFAVHEGHQEAVMWFSAINELLQFFFGGLALLLWMRGRRWLALSLICFALALISKESAVVFLALFGLALMGRPRSCPTWTLLPYVALVAFAVASVVATRAYSFRFADGSFSLHAPFWITWPRGFARLMWIWGWVAAAIVGLRWREAKVRQTTIAALAWIAIALLPYSFLTYSTQIPSRQTYLASAGLAALFGFAMARLWQEGGQTRKIAAVLALVALLHNVGYIWIASGRSSSRAHNPPSN